MCYITAKTKIHILKFLRKGQTFVKEAKHANILEREKTREIDKILIDDQIPKICSYKKIVVTKRDIYVLVRVAFYIKVGATKNIINSIYLTKQTF